MENFGIEFRQATRRAFSTRQVGAIVIMALGLTLATVMFAVGRGYSSFKIPYRNADELVTVEIVSKFTDI